LKNCDKACTDVTDEPLERRRWAAEQYQPDKVDLLLVSEAPPDALDRYFYFERVREQDSLFRYVCRVLLDREPSREGKEQLLAELRDRGVFLIDLKETPVDGTPLATYVPALIERCRELAPRRVVLIKATVYDAAYHHLKAAGLPVSEVRVPFPGSGRQRQFVEAFSRAVAKT
jgi:hypothetical protein